MNQRVLTSALAVYSDLGWSGFSLDVVARRAGVGKAALYLRWSSKEALLHDALEATSLHLPENLDTGSLEGDLSRLATRWLEGFQTPAGRVFLRVYAEAAAHPELLARIQDRLFARSITAGRAIMRRARERGDVPPDTSTALVIDLVAGAVMNHVISTPPSLHQRMVEQAKDYVAQLVQFVLLGIQASAAARASTPSKKSSARAPAKSPRARKRSRPDSPPPPRKPGQGKARATQRQGR